MAGILRQTSENGSEQQTSRPHEQAGMEWTAVYRVLSGRAVWGVGAVAAAWAAKQRG